MNSQIENRSSWGSMTPGFQMASKAKQGQLVRNGCSVGCFWMQKENRLEQPPGAQQVLPRSSEKARRYNDTRLSRLEREVLTYLQLLKVSFSLSKFLFQSFKFYLSVNKTWVPLSMRRNKGRTNMTFGTLF